MVLLSMDKVTLEFYQKNSEKISSIYNTSETTYLDPVINKLNDGYSILDIGCGSGRDLNLYNNLEKKLKILGLEPSSAMIETIEQNYPELKGMVLKGHILDIPREITSHKWDIVMCMAVLQHISEDDIIKAIENIISLVKEDGEIIISVPLKYPVKDNRDKNNRLFVIRNIDFYVYEFYRVGFKTWSLTESNDSLNREDVKWGILTFSI